jgi:hypothetical protein
LTSEKCSAAPETIGDGVLVGGAPSLSREWLVDLT